MINTSNEYKKSILKNRTMYVKCKIVFLDGTEMTLDTRDKEIFTDGFSVVNDTSNAGSFDIGSSIVGQTTFKIYNGDDRFSEKDFSGAVMTPQVGLQLSNNIEWLKKGVFTAEPGQYTGNMITVKAMDNMSKFDRPYSESSLIYPATLGAIVRDACSCCGVSLAADSASFDNDDYVVQNRPDDSTLTFRQVLSWVGQISCHWCRCNENGELSLGWYDTATLEKIQSGFDGGTMNPWTSGDTLDGGTVDPWTIGDTVDGGSFDWSGYHHIYSLSSMNICTDDVVITGIRVTEKTDGESDTVYQNGSSGYVLSIEGNEFIQDGKGTEVAEYLGTKLIGLRFRPLSVSCLSDPSIEAGDVAIVSDRKGNSYPTLITSTTFTAGNYQQISCDAETPLRNSAQRFSESTRIYQEIRKRLSRQKTEWEKAIEKLGDKLSKSSGLYSTIDTMEDGSKIYYLHDKSTLEESMVVWKMNAQAWGVSTDGGKTWNGGMTVDGEAITRILNTIGVNADWINTGAFVVKDSDGNILFRADCNTGRVDIVADSFQLRGKTIEEMAQEKLNDFVSSTFNDTITNLQAQIDGQIETFYFDYEPSLDNEPASSWTTDTDKTKHEGDLFYWKSKGFSYRFMKDGDSWKWQLVQDTDITKAMEQAAEAKDTADGKRRVFIATPTPPYDPGDLWATSTEDGKASIKICKSERAAGAFSSDDWIDPRYVDSADVDGAITDYDSSLGQTEIFNKLTNNGATQGIFVEDGKIWINGEFIKALSISADALKSKSVTSDKISVDDLYAIAASIGGWMIKQGYIESEDGSIKLYSDGRINLGNANLQSDGKAAMIKYGLHVYAGPDKFSDGTDQIKFFNLSHVTSGGHLVFAQDGSTVSYLSSSSKRYKCHIGCMTTEEAQKLLEIPVVWFKYKDGYLSKNDRFVGKPMPGFYAEDVYKYFPEAAQINQDGVPEDWNHRIIIPAMLKLIQDQKKMIDNLAEKTECLEQIIRGEE